jgi:lysophospholipase L1-like esterase
VRRLLPGALLALALLAACAPGGTAPAPSRPGAVSSQRPSPPPPVVYAALGASETAGVGAQDPRAEAWPMVLFRTALPPTAVMYDLGIAGETTEAALAAELPAALSVRPSLVTVWLNVDDLVAGVGVADYEARLGQLVHALRQGGAARVLVANTPHLDRLPLYLACLAGARECPFAGRVPAPAALEAQVDAYDAAIARVVQREGATLVDLHAAGEVPDAHPDWVSGDGFHPSTAGHAAIAATFAAALASRS